MASPQQPPRPSLKAMSTFSIAGRPVGPHEPPYLIAEAGVNHNGDPAIALELVDAAADAGADAVKFQTFSAEALATAAAPQALYQRERAAAASQREMLRALELPPDALSAAFARARKRGMVAFSTPFDLASVDLLIRLGVPCLKVGSGDLTNIFLLRAVASSGKPILLSTGMATTEEVDAAVEAIKGSGDPPLAILHCLSAYPAPAKEANLRAIPTLRARYDLEVGFSDHTTGSTAGVVAVALGAVIIEKHLTLDRRLPGPDHAASMEPAEFADLAGQLRQAHVLLGDGSKRPQSSEADTRRVARRSLVLSRAAAAGTILTLRHLDAKRPAGGISPLRLDEVVGRRLASDLPADAQLRPQDLEPPLSASATLDG